MTNTAANIEHTLYCDEIPPGTHQLEEIVIPPEVPGVTEVVGRMWFLGHRGFSRQFNDLQRWAHLQSECRWSGSVNCGKNLSPIPP
jgi:hypothetical protein